MIGICKRCGGTFIPEAQRKRPQLFCWPCMFRNLTDGLDLPMPPEMLDRYTKHPTLTAAEYQRAINKAATEAEP